MNARKSGVANRRLTGKGDNPIPCQAVRVCIEGVETNCRSDFCHRSKRRPTTFLYLRRVVDDIVH